MGCCDEDNFDPSGDTCCVNLEEEGLPIGQFTTINFVGATVTDSGGGVAQVTIASSSGGFYALPEQWAQNDVAASQAAVALSAQVSTNFDDIPAMRAGSLVGLSVRFSETITAGQAEIIVTINGAPTALTLVCDSGSNPDGGVVLEAQGVITYSAGDLIGATITTDGSFLPVTTDVECWIQVQE